MKNRMVSTNFWNDGYSSNLDPIEKLLFLYLLTNEFSTLAGVYELPKKMMAVETGVDTEMVSKILDRFQAEGKVRYQDGWVVIKNFSKHHPAGSPTVRKGIDDALGRAPQWAKDFAKGIDTLSPSALSSTSTSISAKREYQVVQEDAKPQKQKSDTSYYAVYEAFKNPWPLNWKNNKTEIQAAKNLLQERGVQEIKDALEWYEDMERRFGSDEYFPRVKSPWDLDTKWEKLEDYNKKHNK